MGLCIVDDWNMTLNGGQLGILVTELAMLNAHHFNIRVTRTCGEDLHIKFVRDTGASMEIGLVVIDVPRHGPIRFWAQRDVPWQLVLKLEAALRTYADATNRSVFFD